MRATDQRAAAVDARTAVLSPLDEVAGGDGVFDLLVAARRAMPLQGRRAELDAMKEWCDEDALVGVLVLDGPAGVGKSRLGLEFGLSLESPWVGGRLVPGAGAAAVTAIAACGDPVVVVVDDADTRLDLPAFLDALASHREDARVRVLLISRDGDGLQTGLRPAVSDETRWLTRATVLTVKPHGGAGDRERWYAQAVGRFAREMDVLAPSAKALSGRVGEDHETMLVLLARALLTVLDHSRGVAGIRRLPLAELVGELFHHETAWWESAAASPAWAVSGLASETRQRCILILAVRGGSTEDDAARVLRRIPDLSDAPEAQVRAVARWVLHLYSGAEGIRIEPDLLGDWFIVDRLTRQPNLADAVLADLSPPEMHKIIAILTRATSVLPDAFPLLARVWQISGVIFLDVAVQFAIVHHTPQLDENLAAFIDFLDAPRSTFEELESRLPGHSLPRCLAAVTQRLVRFWRDLADDLAHYPELAAELLRLGSRLSDLGAHTPAHAATAEAVELYRALTVKNPAHGALLALALNNIGKDLDNLGKHRQAHTATAEAVHIYRFITVENPAHQPDLARALNNLGAHLGDLDEHQQAQTAIGEAVDLYRALTAENPAHRPDLAFALNNLSSSLTKLGEHQKAHAAAAEAVQLFRALTAENAVHRPNLAYALNNLGSSLTYLNQHQEAHTATGEAIDHLRALTADNPAHQPDLANALNNLGTAFAHLGEHQRAHVATAEAVDLYRPLSADNPAHQPDLANALNNLGAHLGDLGKHQEAHTATAESVDLYRLPTVRNPAYRPVLAVILTNLGNSWCRLGQHDLEFDVRQESLRHLETLAAVDPDLYEQQYRQALAQLQATYVSHGLEKQAAYLGLPRRLDDSVNRSPDQAGIGNPTADDDADPPPPR